MHVGEELFSTIGLAEELAEELIADTIGEESGCKAREARNIGRENIYHTIGEQENERCVVAFPCIVVFNVPSFVSDYGGHFVVVHVL